MSSPLRTSSAEVSASSVSYDLGPKLRLYQRIGVREYLVWRVSTGPFMVSCCARASTSRCLRDPDGIYHSEVFPGLWLAVDALLAGDGACVEQVLRQGLASPAHAAFVAQLQQTPPRT